MDKSWDYWHFVLLLLCLCFSVGVQAAPQVAAKIVDLRGQVEIQTAGSEDWQVAHAQQPVVAGSSIRTGASGWVALRLEDETLLHLNRNTLFNLRQVSSSAGWHKTKSGASDSVFKSAYRLFSGEAWMRNKNRNISVDIQAPNVSAAIRGTELHFVIDAEQTTRISVLEGRIEASNRFGAMSLEMGEQVVAQTGKPLVKQLLLHPADAVQWTLAVPPLLDAQKSATFSPALRDAYRQLTHGQPAQASAQLQVLSQNEAHSPAVWWLLSLAELTLDRKQQAMAAAQQAVVVAPDSAQALVVLGYNQQAVFELAQAQQSYTRALTLEPENVLALVNLAKVQFGSGYIEEANQTVTQALGLAEDRADVLSLSGFLLLAKGKVEQAVMAFSKAIQQMPGFSEAYLGQGIAYMRQGRTDEAVEAITTAVLLEPRRALNMSYWGKMLYQLGRHQKALDVLTTAQEYDPGDPTPALYRAMILRDLNRPTEAIASLNQAMALNDHRAVYRSRFLLDQDLAVKSVDLSRIYSQLGLDNWARKKAMDSVKLDYSNYSGHNFLAGSLMNDPQRSWSHSSEALLARLLQPANLNSFNTYNQYTTLLDQPGVGGSLQLAVGSQDTQALEGVIYGAQPAYNLAYQMGVSHAKTDGWRETNGEKASDVAAIINWTPTLDDGFMFAASSFSQGKDDLAYPRYEYAAPERPDDRWDSDAYRVEAGYRHQFSPGRNLLLYLARYDNEGSFFTHERWWPLEDDPDFLIHTYQDVDYQRPYTQFQSHLLWRQGVHQLSGGLLYYDMDNDLQGEIREELELDGDRTPLWSTPFGSDQVKRFTSVYVSDVWQLTPDWILEAGLYLEQMQNSDAVLQTDWTVDEVNPRLGVIWQVNQQQTLRLAAFRYLLPMISARLDATDVAGVSLYRNGIEGSLTEELDLQWEYEWERGLVSVNPFYSEREFQQKKPLLDGGSKMLDYNAKASGVELSWNQLLWQGTGLATDYRYLDTRDQIQPENDRREHLLSLRLNYVHPSGLSVAAVQTIRRIDSVDSKRPDETIPLTDLLLGWEFPRKTGRLSLAVNNLFDEQFNWVTDAFVVQGRAPARQWLLGVSVNF